MRKIQDEALQLVLDKVGRSYEEKNELIKSSFKCWEMKILAHVQALGSLTLRKLVSYKMLIVQCIFLIF